MIKIMNFDDILDKILIIAITTFFSCIVMIVADFCVLIIAAVATFLFGPQTYIIPLETLMFMVSAVVGICFVVSSRRYDG